MGADMTRLIYALADLMARPAAFVVLSFGFIAVAILGTILPVSDAFNNRVNLAISLVTLVIGQAVLVTAKRDSAATDLKLDRLIEVSPGSNDAIGAERLSEEEIEAQKREVEERTK